MDDEALARQAEELEKLLPRLMRRVFPSEMDPTLGELPLAQLRVCTLLQSEPRTISALSEELGISVSAVTQVADRLEHAGLVERLCEADDRRVRVLRLTGEGAETMRRRRERRVRRVRAVIERLTPGQRALALEAIEDLVREAESLSSLPDCGGSSGRNGGK